jgi:hypothetical protein
MTVSTIAAPVIYAGNGVTASFSFSYVFFSQADILVQLTTVGTGVVTTSTLGGLGTYDYTVAGVQDVATGEYQSGSIVMNSAPPFGVNIALIPNTPMTQGASFSNAGPLPAKAVESALSCWRLNAPSQLFSRRSACPSRTRPRPCCRRRHCARAGCWASTLPAMSL